jgi:hypothetical protein
MNPKCYKSVILFKGTCAPVGSLIVVFVVWRLRKLLEPDPDLGQLLLLALFTKLALTQSWIESGFYFRDLRSTL